MNTVVPFENGLSLWTFENINFFRYSLLRVAEKQFTQGHFVRDCWYMQITAFELL